MQKQTKLLCQSQSNFKNKTAQRPFFSPIMRMCVGRVRCGIWQAAPPPHMPSGPLCGRQAVGFYMPLCLAKHLQPMSRAGWATCRTKSERTAQHAIMGNGKHRLTSESLIGPNEHLKCHSGGGQRKRLLKLRDFPRRRWEDAASR